MGEGRRAWREELGDSLFTGWSGEATGGRLGQKTSGHLGEKTPQKKLFPSSRGHGQETAVQPSGECVRNESPAQRLASKAHHLAPSTTPDPTLGSTVLVPCLPADPSKHELTRPKGHFLPECFAASKRTQWVPPEGSLDVGTADRKQMGSKGSVVVHNVQATTYYLTRGIRSLGLGFLICSTRMPLASGG